MVHLGDGGVEGVVPAMAGRGDAGFRRAWSVPGEFGDCFLGAGVVYKVFAAGGGGDDRCGGGVVEGAGQPAGDAVQPGDGVIGEQWFVPPGFPELRNDHGFSGRAAVLMHGAQF